MAHRHRYPERGPQLQWGCSLGVLDIECPCELNKDLRERTNARLSELAKNGIYFGGPNHPQTTPIEFGTTTLRLHELKKLTDLIETIDEAIMSEQYPHIPAKRGE